MEQKTYVLLEGIHMIEMELLESPLQNEQPTRMFVPLQMNPTVFNHRLVSI